MMHALHRSVKQRECTCVFVLLPDEVRVRRKRRWEGPVVTTHYFGCRFLHVAQQEEKGATARSTAAGCHEFTPSVVVFTFKYCHVEGLFSSKHMCWFCSFLLRGRSWRESISEQLGCQATRVFSPSLMCGKQRLLQTIFTHHLLGTTHPVAC